MAGQEVTINRKGVTTCENGQWEASNINFAKMTEGGETSIEVSLGKSRRSGFTVKTTMRKDTHPPSLTMNFTAGYINTQNQRSFELSGTCSEPGRVRFAVEEGATKETPCSVQEGWSASLDLSKRPEEELIIAAHLVDTAGNNSAEVNRMAKKDIARPTISLDPPLAINENNGDHYRIVGRCSEQDREVSIFLEDGVTILSPTSQPICDANGEWMTTLQANGLNDGEVFIVIHHLDRAKNDIRPFRRNLNKDTVPPRIIGQDIEAPSDGTYTDGVLDFVVAFNEKIVVNIEKGIPRIALNIGGDTRYASYIGSESKKLTFRHVVHTGDRDSGGIALSGNHNIDLNDGVIQDMAGNALSDTELSVPSLTGIVVNGLAPMLKAVAVQTAAGDDDYYKEGETVVLLATFNEEVTITGAPELILDVGGVEKTAHYRDQGAGYVATHEFTYTIADGENDHDGIAVTGIRSHTAIVNSSNKNVAEGLAPQIGIDHVIVDTIEPIVANLKNEITPQKSKTWNWQCSPDNEVSCHYRFAINTNSSHSFDHNEQYQDISTATQEVKDGDYYIHVQARDAAGNESAVVSISVTLDNTAPALQARDIGVPENKIYSAGDHLDFMVRFDSATWADTGKGIPRIVLDVGDDTRYAHYIVGSGTGELTFRYTVRAEDHAPGGIAIINNNDIELNGAILRDRAHNHAASNGLTVPDLSAVLVDGRAPILIGVRALPGVYRAGRAIVLKARFSEPVTIEGAPELVLDVGGPPQMARYTGRDGHTSMVHDFVYLPINGQNDADGIRVIDMNSHIAIRDSDHNVLMANISPAIELRKILVDTTPPALDIITTRAIDSSNATSYQVSGLCDEMGALVRVFVGRVAAIPPPTCRMGDWITHINVSGLTNGSVAIRASQIDSAGNVGHADEVIVIKTNEDYAYIGE